MDNDKFQELVLQQLKALTEGQNNLSKRLESVEKGQANLEAKVDRIDTGLLKLETRIENEVVDKIRGLFDARDVQNDVNQRIFSALGRIEAKIDVLQMETAHIRRVK